MNFKIITKNHSADFKVGSPELIDFRANGTHESHPTVWVKRVKQKVKLFIKADGKIAFH